VIGETVGAGTCAVLSKANKDKVAEKIKEASV